MPCFRNHIQKSFCWFGHIIVFLMSCDFISCLNYKQLVFAVSLSLYLQASDEISCPVSPKQTTGDHVTNSSQTTSYFAFTDLCPRSLEGLGVLVAGVIVWRHVPVRSLWQIGTGFSSIYFHDNSWDTSKTTSWFSRTSTPQKFKVKSHIFLCQKYAILF